MDPQRLLLVHAHPDDESLNNGATMAKYVAEGHGVTLVTCTLGEEGEVDHRRLVDDHHVRVERSLAVLGEATRLRLELEEAMDRHRFVDRGLL